QNVPVQGAGHLYRGVGEAMGLFERQGAAVESAEHHPAAFRAQVNGGKIKRHAARRHSKNMTCSSSCIVSSGRAPPRPSKNGAMNACHLAVIGSVSIPARARWKLSCAADSPHS